MTGGSKVEGYPKPVAELFFMKEEGNWVLTPRAKKKEEKEEEWRSGEPCWVSVCIPEMVDH